MAEDSEFELRANDPQLWLSQARQLQYAASQAAAHLELLAAERQDSFREPQVGTFKAAQLLLGFAVENALKAVGVAKGIIQADAQALRLASQMRNHRLVPLAEAVGFDLSDSERALLDRLSVFLRWRARYPTPHTSLGLARDAPSRQMLTDDVRLGGALISRVEGSMPA